MFSLAADSWLTSQPRFPLPDNAIIIENDVPNRERARTMMNGKNRASPIASNMPPGRLLVWLQGLLRLPGAVILGNVSKFFVNHRDKTNSLLMLLCSYLLTIQSCASRSSRSAPSDRLWLDPHPVRLPLPSEAPGLRLQDRLQAQSSRPHRLHLPIHSNRKDSAVGISNRRTPHEVSCASKTYRLVSRSGSGDVDERNDCVLQLDSDI